MMGDYLFDILICPARNELILSLRSLSFFALKYIAL